MKKRFSLLTALALVVMCILALPAAQAANESLIRRVEFDGGKVEVDFSTKVTYGDVKVTAVDSSGKAYATKLIDLDDDDLEFRIVDAGWGKAYSFTISGIKGAGEAGYVSVTGAVELPAIDKVTVKEIDYDAEDRELTVDFAHRVKYKGVKAALKDGSGKSYSVRIVEKDDDELEMRVSRLERGRQYTLTISGIRHRDASSYGTVTETFTA